MHRGERLRDVGRRVPASLQGAWKVVTTTLRFRNKLGRPLVLGYVVGSGGATDMGEPLRGEGWRRARHRAHQPPARRQVRHLAGTDGGCPVHPGLERARPVREHLRPRPHGPGDRAGRERAEHARAGVPAADRRPRGRCPGRALLSRRPPARRPRGSAPTTGRCSRPRPCPRPRRAARRPRRPGDSRFRRAGGGRRSALCSGHELSGRRPVQCHLVQTAAAASGKNQVVRFNIRVKNHTAQPLRARLQGRDERRGRRAGQQLRVGKAGHARRKRTGNRNDRGRTHRPAVPVRSRSSREAQLVVAGFDAGSQASRPELHPEHGTGGAAGNAQQQWQKVREYAMHLPAAGAVPLSQPSARARRTRSRRTRSQRTQGPGGEPESGERRGLAVQRAG